MPSSHHAVLWIEHQTAHIVQFDAEHVQVDTVRTHHHHGKHPGHEEHGQTEFFNEICRSLEGIAEILVVGPHTEISDFKSFTEKHYPTITNQIVAYEPRNQGSEAQLVSMARDFFAQYDRITEAEPLMPAGEVS